METSITVRPATPADRDALLALHDIAWGGTVVVAHERTYELTELATLVAEVAGALVGALSYSVDGASMEIVSIYADPPGEGGGSALLAAAVAVARDRRLRRVWLVTTNDNLDALRFYQRRGMRIARVDPGAVDRARRLKPAIPEVGSYGIPMRDELTLELVLD